jgi:hypothetical protein
MKRKKINPDEEFEMAGQVFAYSVIDGNLKLRVVGSADVKPTKPKFIPPSLQDVKDYFKSKKYLESAAIKFHQYYDAAEWKDSKGNQVKNWRQKAIGIWFKKENEDLGSTVKPTTVNNFFQSND